MPNIAVIGDNDSVLGFKAVGVTVFPVSEPDEVKAVLRSLARDETYRVIFITEEAAAAAKEQVANLQKRMTPVLTLIPGSRGSMGFGMEQIKRNVEKAVGADILFGKEGR
ncbi:MAG: V-type ATP synthase subunit F [Firmicutes bacterium]|nr:V-type ATP synthase subunit F [Bacillota bacterium]